MLKAHWNWKHLETLINLVLVFGHLESSQTWDKQYGNQCDISKDGVWEKGDESRAWWSIVIAKSKNRAQVRTSVGSLASKFKWKRTNLETKVEVKVKGAGWLNWDHKKEKTNKHTQTKNKTKNKINSALEPEEDNKHFNGRMGGEDKGEAKVVVQQSQEGRKKVQQKNESIRITFEKKMKKKNVVHWFGFYQSRLRSG